jgi:GTPase
MEKLKIAICGPVDAGKSSLIGVLTSGELDNGRGSARNKILKHEHEIESGRTSNITFNSLIYKINNDNIHVKTEKTNDGFFKIENILKIPNQEKVVSLIDLAGHEKYFKTTLFGVSGMFVDYGIVVIGANTDITRLTREHIGILFYLKVPFIIVITKIDMAPKDVYENLKKNVDNLVRRNKLANDMIFLNESSDFEKFIKTNSLTTELIPVVSLSNTNGLNVNNLHQMLCNLPPRKKWDNTAVGGSIFYIDSTFKVPGIGTVVSGTLKGENIKVRQKLFIGPIGTKFYEITVRSLHNSIREDQPEIVDNESSCIAIKFVNPKETIDRENIRKGMVVVSNEILCKKFLTKKFRAKIKILHHSTTMKSGYCPVIHCGPIRQSAIMKINNNEFLRSGDEKIVDFEFKYHLEFIESDVIFFFRDGSTKGVGTIVEILNDDLNL